MTVGTRLGHVEPRERAGAQTGRKYEYQYERTAKAALELLREDQKHVCVYCDWHDDYVIEVGDPPTRYLFRQVKGRKSSQGPWKFSEFFGVAMKRAAAATKNAPSVKPDAIVPLMLLHHMNFGPNCSGTGFVTNAGFEPALTGFLEAVAGAQTLDALPDTARIAFDHVARGYAAASPPICSSKEELLGWLQTMSAMTDQAQLDDADGALLEVANIVTEYSEIDLVMRQAKQIAREIIDGVRRRVAHSTTIVPEPDDQLRTNKGIVVADLLGVLSLSAPAYEQLKAGAGADAVKNLSRLQRFCRKHGFESQLVAICGFKARWDVWRTIERHFLNSADYLLLLGRAEQVLRADLSMERAVAEAKDVAGQFEGITGTPLTPEHVLGLVFSLAAESEMLGPVRAEQ